MKKSKTFRRLAAVLLAGTMIMAMGTSAFADDEPTPVTSVDVTKKVTAEEKVQAPNESFIFSVVPVTVGDGTTVDGAVVYSGIAGGASFAEGKNTISFAPGDALEKSTQITLNAGVFEKPGIYRYQVDETAGNYDGMTYSTASYYLDLYVVNGSNGLVIEGAIARDVVSGKKETAIEFENVYSTNDLTLKKVVTGNQANLSQKFDFYVTINGVSGEKYTVEVNGEAKEPITSGERIKYTLGHNDVVTIYGLSANDTYVIEEENYSSDGYTTTITGADTANGRIATGKTDTADDNVVYTNNKEVTTPTGIVMNIAPYILMVAVAAVLAVVFLRKRNTFEN